MNQKTLLVLGAATCAAVALTAALQSSRADETRPAGTDGRLLPALEGRVNDVRQILIEGAAGAATLKATDAGWVLAEASDYPADDAKVRTLLLDLRDARRIEAKTANPDRHGRLGLVAPDAEGASSTRVTLSDGSGAPIEALLIGKQRTSRAEPNAAQLGVTPGAQYYAMPNGGPQTFLASGNLRVDARALGWVNQEFLNVDRARIAAATITHPDGEVVDAVREDMSANEMVVRNVPEGMVAKTPSGTAQLVGALQRVRFDDVRAAGSMEWPEDALTTASFTTEDGLRIDVETLQAAAEDDPSRMVTWARVRAGLVPEEPAEPVEAAGDDGSEGAAPQEGPTRAELQAEVDGILAAVDGWAYALPGWKESSLRLRMDAVAETPAEEATPAPGAEPQVPLAPTPIQLTPPPATEGSGGGI